MTQSEHITAQRSSLDTATHGAAHADLTGDLSMVVDALHEMYDDQVGALAVSTEIQQVADRFTNARIRSFVPLFVQRYTSVGLRARGARRPQPAPAA